MGSDSWQKMDHELTRMMSRMYTKKSPLIPLYERGNKRGIGHEGHFFAFMRLVAKILGRMGTVPILLNKVLMIKNRLDFFRMFFLTIRMASNKPHHNTENSKHNKNYIESINALHFCYSSLSKYIPKRKNRADTSTPHIANVSENCLVANGPNTLSAKISLLISKKCLEIFRCCRVVNLINEYILSQIKMFVKQKIKNMKLCRRIGTAPTLFVRCVRLAISRCLSVGYGGGGILKYALLLTVVLLNGFLVVSVSAKDSEEKIDVSAEIRKMKSKDLNEKLDAMNKLKKVKKTDKRAKDALLKELKVEKNPYLKSRIIESLVDDQDEVTTREIIYTLQKDTSTDVRYAAAFALAYSKDESVVPVLISVFLNENEDLGVRFQAADALTHYKPTEEIYQCFVKGLENPNPLVRIQAITSMSLCFSGTEERTKIIPLLKEMLKDKDEMVRNVARERLEIFGIKEVKEK